MKATTLCLAFVLLAASYTFAAPVPVTSCGAVLSTDAANYRLMNDLDCPGFTAAVEIPANTVLFDLNGFSVGGAFMGIYVTGAKAIIKNGTVQNNQYGIEIENTQFAKVTGVVLSGNLGFGIELYESRKCTITNNVLINHVGSAIAITTPNSMDHQITQNTISNTTGTGIFSQSENKSTFNSNEISGGDYGISLRGNNDQVVSNIISGVTINGIHLFSVGNTLVKGNSVFNGETGIFVAGGSSGVRITENRTNNNTAAGIYLHDGTVTSTVEGNLTVRNQYGIQVTDGSAGSTIKANLSWGNSSLDLADGNVGCVNAWTLNRFETDSEGDGPGSGCIQ
jgi:parallel beta-helix repeat protein